METIGELSDQRLPRCLYIQYAHIKKNQLTSSSTLGFMARNAAVLLLQFVISLQLFDFMSAFPTRMVVSNVICPGFL